MKISWLFDPDVLYRSRAQAIGFPVVFALAALFLGTIQVSKLAEYREVRYGTEMTSGVVESVTNRRNTESRRSFLESVVKYSFKTRDGRTRSGTMAYPAVRMEHLKRGTPVEVFYKADNPDRSTTADGLFMRLWWGLIPQCAFLVFWSVLTGICIVQSICRWRRGNKQSVPAAGSFFERKAARGANPIASASS